jgi:hypothetical protein
MIQILRSWQSVRNAQNGINVKRQLKLSLTRLRKRKVFIDVMPTPPRTFPVGSSGFSFEREMKIMRR